MGHGEVPNVVGLVVASCDQSNQISGGQVQYQYTYNFSVSLPPQSPPPSFATGGNLSASFRQDDNNPQHYELFVDYNNPLPTAAPPLPSDYKTYPLVYTTPWVSANANRGAVTFEGTNTNPQGKKVKAKGSTTVTKVGGQVPG